MTAFAVFSAGLGGAAFAVLAGLVLIAPGSGPVGRMLVAACFGSVLMLGATALHLNFAGGPGSAALVQLTEIVRDAGWLLFLGRILLNADDAAYRRRLVSIAAGFAALMVFAAVMVAAPPFARGILDADPLQIRKYYLIASLLIALGGLVMTEHLLRSASSEHRWALKHLCFGIGLMFAFDFYMYANAVLFNGLDLAIWSARGIVNALAMPLIALSASRNRDWKLNIFVSRRVVFQGVTLFAGGAYLVIMAAAGYYIQIFGGEWGRALKIAFFCAALVVLLSLFFSSQLRSRVRLFLARHFYRNKYEYGDEWLKFTAALSHAALNPDSLHRTILTAVAEILDSPGGLIFRKVATGGYAVAAQLNIYQAFREDIPPGSGFAAALQDSATAWDLDGDDEIAALAATRTPNAITALPRVAFVVPIVHNAELLAFLVLARPRSNAGLDDEDRDLLSTVGRQAASYLALLDATNELSEVRQFETFNRLSAFLVHDLKNVVAQLSLITRNAERHGDKPEFVADAFQTVGDAVDKMNRMLASLRQMQVDVAGDDDIDLGELCTEAVAHKTDCTPQPELRPLPEDPLCVRGQRDRLLSVVEHLLQNAVEATSDDGTVEVGVSRNGRDALLTITDTGSGMTREFINTRLFKPFDTTKGKAGMGIGAYESRHVVSSMNGELRVNSEPGEGTSFSIVLPLAEPEEQRADSDVTAEA